MQLQPAKAHTREPQEWRETSLKGKMAESLVYDLLQESGNEIYKIGYEAILPGLAKIEKLFKRNTAVSEKIRAIPDFFVIDTLGKPHIVEVKFRWHPSGHENDHKKIELIKYFWEEAEIIFVNCSEKPYFRLCKFPFMTDGRRIMTEPLRRFGGFNISRDTLDKFEALVEKYFTPTLNKGFAARRAA